MSSKPKLFSLILRIVFTEKHLNKLRRLLWSDRKLRISQERLLDTHGILFISAPLCFAHSLLPLQPVLVHLSYENSSGETHSINRYMKLGIGNGLRIDQFTIGKNDLINICGFQQITKICVTRIVSYSALSFSLRSLVHADTVRLSPINNPNVDSSHADCSEELREFFKIPRVFYSGDFVSIDKQSFGETQRVYYKFESSTSPCIVDRSCSLYESSHISSRIPYSGTINVPHVPKNVEEIVQTMYNIFTHKESESSSELLLLNGSSGSGKKLAVRSVAIRTHRCILEEDAYILWSELRKKAEKRLKTFFDRVHNASPCTVLITNADVLGFSAHKTGGDNRYLSTLQSILHSLKDVHIVLICSTKQTSLLPNRLLSLCSHTLSIPSMEEDTRMEYIHRIFPNNIDSRKVARETAGFVVSELNRLLIDSKYNAYRNERSVIDWCDVEWSIDKRNASFADVIGAPKIPNVSWDDVGGLEDTKLLIQESIESNWKASKSGLRRSGIILFGPPGCGKTLLAKAVATEYKISFLSVKGPELLNKYVGQSEDNLRKVFERARQASPCVVFFDELDSLAPNRGRSGDSGGVMDRIVAQLLSELDSLHSSPSLSVFVMAATNRADLLDPSLLTPGRFDKVINIIPPEDVESKERILKAVSRKMKMARNIDWKEIASLCTGSMSGADLYSVVANGAKEALRETVKRIQIGEISEEEAVVTVCMRHLRSAVQQCKQQQEIGMENDSEPED